jgi:hypothetical protein
MGLTLSDTIRLDEADQLKLFFAPRGESTDGPIAFMHRPTGMVNPDVPLGHHIGQDVGHITSTVLGASVKLGEFHIEASAFHGAEPEPTEVDLPLGGIDSGALRLIEEFTPEMRALASFAYVHGPEPEEPNISFELRASASLYNHFDLGTWALENAFIYGGISRYDHTSVLNSLLEEFWLHHELDDLWGRIEALQRTAGELEITAADPNRGHWMTAFTLGYTRTLASIDKSQLGLGAAVTLDLLPGEFSGSYGSSAPLTGQIFLRLSGMKMWEL